ncbi:cupredoxin family copper-binding protein [Streptomyces canus]|uniref:cupredoxin domain-containing protein n=1 Tax=Streptomyces canus TaxID=58343 RepID=UPI0036E97137
MRGVLRAAAVLALLVVGMLPYGHEASAATFQVAMKGYAFSPASLSVPAGSTVTWTNYDTAPHDVKTTSGPLAIHSPMLNKGQSWSFTFTTAGAYGYVCTVHPDMTAGITVRAAAPKPTPAAPTQHEHTQPSTGQQHSTMPGMTAGRSPAAPRAGSSPSPTASQAAVPQTAPSPQVSQAAQPAANQAAASTARPLDPLLVLAGLVAGVAVLCLLLVGSRAAASAPRGGEEGV